MELHKIFDYYRIYQIYYNLYEVFIMATKNKKKKDIAKKIVAWLLLIAMVGSVFTIMLSALFS